MTSSYFTSPWRTPIRGRSAVVVNKVDPSFPFHQGMELDRKN